MGVRVRRRRQLAVLLAGVLAAGCGSRVTASGDTVSLSTSAVETTIAAPTSTTAPTTTAATTTAPERPAAATRSALAPVPGPLAFCDEPVFPVGPTEPPPTGDEVLRVEAVARALQQLVDAHRDVLTGVWWDPATREIVIAGVDRVTTERLVAGAATQQTGHRIAVAAHSYAELDAVQQRVTPAAAKAGVAYSSYPRMDGRVQIDLAIRDRASVDAIAAIAGDDADLICVSGGADPVTVAPLGPQASAGDGWRLVADAPRHMLPTPITVVSSATAYAQLWAALKIGGEPPPVDFATDLVFAFVHGESPGCEHRLDALTVDTGSKVVRPTIVLPGGDRPCTLVAGSHTFVIAVPRTRLPALPFRVEMRSVPCSAGCEGDPLDVAALSS